ncbi:BTAD domain-containing putative transcriptional regulator [Streptomyces sp. NPDC048448]|uniref:AfsR/SARP family transcriptional regulator n=1 Tax=unclassified Streptomyces TaxID=2593676 RepID=UPI00143E4DF8|nr:MULTISPECIES: AfsR/SARP family transcriptional regulator [unclassified Streptomyces]QIY60479.1 AfsR/SARP family transcriptional regulator [Streptomyces sp. RPA4-2]
MLTFRTLGLLEVTRDGRPVTPTAPKVRQMLALLLARRNTLVSISAIAGELWERTPPRSATATVQTYVYQLRKLLQSDDETAAGTGPLVTRATGYILRVAPGDYDAEEFERLTVQARSAIEAGDARTATERLQTALAWWSGQPFADIGQGPCLQAYALRLEELHMHALELRITAGLGLGQHRELVAELKELASTYPLHEWFQGGLIIALQRCGRSSEALQVYQRLRQLLRDELGLEPSAGLQQIRQHVLMDRVTTADLSLLPG